MKFLLQQNCIYRLIALLPLILLPLFSSASKTQKAFEALKIYDYFKAKKIFYADLKKNTAPASYGLALIYSRTDNPFTNFDSAAKYIHLGYNAYTALKQPLTFSGFKIDSATIIGLCDSIAIKQFEKIKNSNSIKELEVFVTRNYLANSSIISEAIFKRDEIEFKQARSANSSDSIYSFIKLHPQSSFLIQALTLHEHLLFEELTGTHQATDYISFIKKHPKNVMVNNAYESLYNLYQKNSDTKGLKSFINDYPLAPQYNEAWKQYFALSVKTFSNDELEKFLNENPDFPFKNSILKELELSKLNLLPYQNEELFGFIDTNGKLIISAQYDEVSDFKEGLSIVSKNDSVYFVNKENKNVFEKYYDDAYPFYKGIAAVKQNNQWTLINRQGQNIKYYDEINELSNNAYIIKSNNKYGAINYFGEIIIETQFDKLGDFKNEFAYYIENNKYGFVSKTGAVHKAEFEWISDFGENNLAIFKQNNRYGIIHSNGNKLLEAEFDQILKAKNNIYIVVKNSMYGFYHGKSCWLSAIGYDYLKEKPQEFYTNGTTLKLIKKDAQALMDFNGKILIDFGAFDQINFFCNSLLKVKKKNKFGYIDKKFAVTIPAKYEEACDFADSVAIVKLKENNLLINLSGKEIYTSPGQIKKISTHYYLVEWEQNELINYKGEKIFTNIKSVQMPNNSLLVITLSNNEIKLLND